MSVLSEDRVYARHRRRRGAVLIVGSGAVGSLMAPEFAAMGISPLWLLDYRNLKTENIVRHYLGAPEVGQNKACGTADRIRRDYPWCHAKGINEDFLRLPADVQRRRVQAVDVVVAATDEADCQRRVNEVCLAAEKPAVYPAVWVDQRVRDAEVGEILWVLPGRHTPCYECWVTFRRASADAQAARGTQLDIRPISVATAQVVAALLDPADERSAILDPERTAIYIHGLTPTSPGVRATFHTPGLQSRNVRVPFPPTRCPACGGQQPQRTTSQVPLPPPLFEPTAPLPPLDPQPRAVPPPQPAPPLSPRALRWVLIILGLVVLVALARPTIALIVRWASPDVAAAPEPAPATQQAPASPSPQGTPAAMPGDFRGTWSGQVSQGREIYHVNITLTGGQVATTIGTSSYPELECGGNLLLIDVKGDTLSLSERLSYGSADVSTMCQFGSSWPTRRLLITAFRTFRTLEHQQELRRSVVKDTSARGRMLVIGKPASGVVKQHAGVK